MTAKKDIGIDFVDILSDIAMILDTSMVILSNHDDQALANQLVAFAQELAGRAAIVGGVKHD
ncbi:hypothetical protein [Rahnella inusitata]|uniref:hypothetical protein n=1 Tax=Rahnella inusitata TaxID=58169 RepID=UPI0039AFA20C